MVQVLANSLGNTLAELAALKKMLFVKKFSKKKQFVFNNINEEFLTTTEVSQHGKISFCWLFSCPGLHLTPWS